MTNRPLARFETEALKKIASGLRHLRGDWLGGIVHWNDVKNQVDAMLTSGTNDGEDIVAELTDEDAKGRPWVMAGNDGYAWSGPYTLISGPPMTKRYVTVDICHISCAWIYARPLTPEEKVRYSK